MEEAFTKVGHAKVSSLVGADALHGIRVVIVECKASWGVLLQACSSRAKVLGQIVQDILIAQVPNVLNVVVET